MKCKKCGCKINEDDLFCINCGSDVKEQRRNESKKSRKGVFIIILVVILILCSVTSGFLLSKINFKKYDPDLTVTNEVSKETTDNALVESKTTEETSTVVSTKVETTVDAGKLYRPNENKFCDQYERYISGSSEGQEYAKMRFGPSKSAYNVVGQIYNGEKVTVQTEDVNGWTLIYYEGTEGWVRTDFLYKNYSDCFKNETVLPDYEIDGYYGYVDVYGEYDGTPLNMRSAPTSNSNLICQVPDDSEIRFWGGSDETDDWMYIEYNGNYGWVLSKYVEYCEVGDKPVLYLYPTKTIDVDVHINLKDTFFTCTYPKYNDGWSVTANPDGTIINKADNEEYSYLYWELGGNVEYSFEEGFVVKGDEAEVFLKKTLKEIGLTPREYNEFIVYWLPIMQKNEYNLVSFQTDKYTDNVELDITPKPDSVLRVFMAFKSIDEPINIPPQHFDNFSRNGFTVVEWGGTQVK